MVTVVEEIESPTGPRAGHDRSSGTCRCFYLVSAMLKVILNSFAAVVVIAIIGAFGILSGYPLLFASLGPTVALQAVMPEQPISRPWNVAVGHLLALGSAMAAVYMTGAAFLPPFSNHSPLSWLRVGAAAIAIMLGLCGESVLRASHAPSASTALLIALGIMPASGRTAITIVCGVALVTALGEAMRQLRLRFLK